MPLQGDGGCFGRAAGQLLADKIVNRDGQQCKNNGHHDSRKRVAAGSGMHDTVGEMVNNIARPMHTEGVPDVPGKKKRNSQLYTEYQGI